MLDANGHDRLAAGGGRWTFSRASETDPAELRPPISLIRMARELCGYRMALASSQGRSIVLGLYLQWPGLRSHAFSLDCGAGASFILAERIGNSLTKTMIAFRPSV